LVIAEYFPPTVGGASTRAYNVVKGLLAMGHRIVVITAFPDDIPKNESQIYSYPFLVFSIGQQLKVIRVWMPPLSHAGFARRLVLFLSFCISSLFTLPIVGKIDVVWAANPNFFSMGPAIIYGLSRGTPIVRDVGDLWPEVIYDLGYMSSALVRRLLNIVSKITYIFPKAITPISESQKEYIKSHYNIPETKIFVIENGVDVSLFHPEKVDPNFYGEGFIVMYSGVLGVVYDFDVILEAARNLLSYDEIRFVIRGFGECQREIEEKIMEYQLTNVFLDTRVVDEDILNIVLNSAKVFVLPMKPIESTEMGLPTKVFEYQALGKPIICCSNGEPGRYINLTSSGLVTKAGDSKALADAILRLYEDRELQLKLGMNGLKYVSENVTCEKIGFRMYEIFKRVKHGCS